MYLNVDFGCSNVNAAHRKMEKLSEELNAMGIITDTFFTSLNIDISGMSEREVKLVKYIKSLVTA